ncbi:TatD family nuclease-associated radical SAM protein [Megasphaera paucivorans]|uniref:Radical SAM protein, TatD family-associated n=1 Tax=Megasphaera paucivorans TaxID=349095 RepID=A0A1G9RMF3_9FIRM|nr:TatD family nuclease-associated radical SAM protein [Megasphaera paucivorans]SDM24240.1 radical SAM protein, TatD family-associated [Megasphaera paucivorans]
MIIYTYDKGRYLSLEESLKRQPQGMRSVYINMTNRCNCACTFCLRNVKKMDKTATLWLETEPSAEEIQYMLDTAPWTVINEIVFCGFGEPTMRLSDVVQLLTYVKHRHPHVQTRINTNGLSDLEYGYDTSSVFDHHILDTISISLNASNAERYLTLTRSKFGAESFEAMLAFAGHCKRYIPHVVMTIVDKVESDDEIKACQTVCAQRGLTLRVRAYEEN